MREFILEEVVTETRHYTVYFDDNVLPTVSDIREKAFRYNPCEVEVEVKDTIGESVNTYEVIDGELFPFNYDPEPH